MNVSFLWSKSAFTSPIFAQDLQKFGSLLKWGSYQEDVLEVGCATGLITSTVLYPYIKDRIRKLVAVDKRQSMIDFAKDHNECGKIEYRKMNVMKQEEVEKMKGKFGHIFAPLVAHWIPDNRSLLNMLRMMLKPKGQIFLTIMVDTPIHQSFHRHAAEQTWAKYLPNEKIFCDYGENPSKFLTDLAKGAGFKVDVCESQRGNVPIEHYPDIVKALVSFYDNIELIPEELRESYYRDHLKNNMELCTYLGEPDKVDFPYEKMVCIATRID